MTFLTADGRGKNGLRKPFSFPAVSNNCLQCVTTMEWAHLPKDLYWKLPLALSFYSWLIHLCQIQCLNVIFLEICKAWELFNSIDIFRCLSGTHKAGLTWAQAGSMHLHVLCLSVLLGTAAMAPWRGPLWATAGRVDSDKGAVPPIRTCTTGSEEGE